MKILQNYRFDNMRGKTRDILILERITDFSTTGSAGLKRRNNGRKHYLRPSEEILSLLSNKKKIRHSEILIFQY